MVVNIWASLILQAPSFVDKMFHNTEAEKLNIANCKFCSYVRVIMISVIYLDIIKPC